MFADKIQRSLYWILWHGANATWGIWALRYQTITSLFHMATPNNFIAKQKMKIRPNLFKFSTINIQELTKVRLHSRNHTYLLHDARYLLSFVIGTPH